MASIIYNQFFYQLALGNIDWEGDTIMTALVTSAYTPVRGDTTWNGSNGPGAVESSGSGYTAGGDTLAGMAVTKGDTTLWDATDVTWGSSTVSAYYAVVYDTTASNTLMFCFDFGDTQASSNGDFTIQWNISGLLGSYQSA